MFSLFGEAAETAEDVCNLLLSRGVEEEGLKLGTLETAELLFSCNELLPEIPHVLRLLSVFNTENS